MTPPLGFSTPPQIPNITTSKRPPVTTTVFIATTPENMPFAYHASTSTNPNLTISLAFVEENYEILEHLLRERRRQIRNEDLRTELNYFNEDYDEERETEPRPEPHREATPTIGLRSHGPMYVPPNIPAYLNPAGPGFITPFVCWIKDYPLSDGLKMPSHVGSYDGKRDPDNFIHLFTAKFQSYFIQQNKFTKTHLAVHNIKQREGESTRAFITRYTNDTLQILGLHEEQRVLGFVHDLRTRCLVEHLSTNHPSTYKGLMEKTYTWVEAREVATNGALNDQRDSFKRHLRTQIQEAVNSGQLSHLVKGIKRNEQSHLTSHEVKAKRIKARENNAPVIIEAMIFGRKVRRVHMNGRSSCKIIYESCFEKLNRTIKATKVNLKTPIVGFSGERSWSVGEVPSDIKIGYTPFSGTETLKFVIVRFDSPHNMLLGRTVMQRMGIVVLMIHGAIKLHTKNRIETVLLTDEANEGTKWAKRIPVTSKERVLSCVNAEEKIIVNDKYPD
nr:hypothetical protein [Tanacetum cinerariifolium]